jgi:L-lactate dehydrogenase
MGCNIAVVGAGEVARSVALVLATADAGEVALAGDDAEATAADVASAAALLGTGARVRAVAALGEAAGGGVVVATPAPDELPAVAAEVARHLPGAVLVVAGRPVDAAYAVLLRGTNFPRGRVLGATALVAGARLRGAIASAAGVSVDAVSADVLGGPGPRAVPVLSCATVAGTPASEVLGDATLSALATRVVAGAPPGPAEIAGAVRVVVDAVTGDRRSVLTCAVACRGELGIEDAVMAMPVVVGRSGAEAILEPRLSPTELDALRAAAAGAEHALGPLAPAVVGDRHS